MNAPHENGGLRAVPLAVLFLLSSCDKRAATNQLPTATEVFHLRSECAVLGRKILNDHGVFDPQQIVSRYDPRTNRCYVEYSSGVGATIVHQLYDAQTGELLASTLIGSAAKSGLVKRGLATLPTDGDARYKAAEDFIEKMMADDRTRLHRCLASLTIHGRIVLAV